MPHCECQRVPPPIEVRCFTGPTQTQVDCDVNSHPQFKHWVYVKNHRAYPLEIYVKATIAGDRLVKFGDCPDFAFPDKNYVKDHAWECEVTLGKDEDELLVVFLSSDAKGGNPQQIDLYVGTRKPGTSVDQPYSDYITVTA